jgi:hypothetical protein
VSAVIAEASEEPLNAAERAFLTAVFLCKGIAGPPTGEEFREGLRTMSAYAQQVQDNPPDESQGAETEDSRGRWFSHVSDEERLMLAAIAFVRFGVTKPASSQWEAAYVELFGLDS